MSASTLAPTDTLSINGASRWLREHGVKPYTRHAIYGAIARNRLRVFAASTSVILIRRTDLERYAAELAKP